MSVQPTTNTRAGEHDARESTTTCAAPSCWETGDRIKIAGDNVENAPVLCETHRQAYLGVSS